LIQIKVPGCHRRQLMAVGWMGRTFDAAAAQKMAAAKNALAA
jgi:hypothetical protein